MTPRAAIMPVLPARRPTLIDAMIFVAAAALGFAGVRAEWTKHFHPAVMYIEVPPDPPLGTFVGSFATTSMTVAGPITGPIGSHPWLSTLSAWAGSARFAAPCLAASSLATLLIRLWQPCPPRARLVCQAGLVASLGATLALGIQLIITLLKFLLESFNPTVYMPIQNTGPMPSRLSWVACQTTQPRLIGVVVLASWLTLAVGGHRRKGGWIDQVGIAVGLGWVALLLLDLLGGEQI